MAALVLLGLLLPQKVGQEGKKDGLMALLLEKADLEVLKADLVNIREQTALLAAVGVEVQEDI